MISFFLEYREKKALTDQKSAFSFICIIQFYDIGVEESYLNILHFYIIGLTCNCCFIKKT